MREKLSDGNRLGEQKEDPPKTQRVTEKTSRIKNFYQMSRLKQFQKDYKSPDAAKKENPQSENKLQLYPGNAAKTGFTVEPRRKSMNSMNTYFIKGNMYIINENSFTESASKGRFNTSINQPPTGETGPKGLGAKVDSNSTNALSSRKKCKIQSMGNFLGKRPDPVGENSSNQFRISKHRLESPLLHNFTKDAQSGLNRGTFDNFSLANNSEKNNLSSIYLTRSPQYQSWKFLPRQETLLSLNKAANLPPVKSHFFPRDPQVKSPLTPDYRMLKKRTNYSRMNLDLRDINLSIKAPNRSFNCSPYLHHSPLSVFEPLKHFPSHNNFSNNFGMDGPSYRPSDKIQYSFKETRILNKEPSPGRKRRPLFNKISELCRNSLPSENKQLGFLNAKANQYFDSLVAKDTDRVSPIPEEPPK